MKRLLGVLSLALMSVVVIGGPGTQVSACSCASVDPIDALGFGGVVFAGTVVDSVPGDDGNDIWTFDVEAVVQGDVGPNISVVGDTFCGSDLTGFTEPIIVYASRYEGDLRVQGCLPNPPLERFRQLVDEAARQAASLPGSGPPGALVAGRDKLANLTVIDQAGRIMARASLDHEPLAAAHCPGTSLVSTWSYGPAIQTDVDEPQIAPRNNVVSLVDLATMDVVDVRDIDSDWLGVTGDEMLCLDGGSRVVTTRGFGPDGGQVTVATANADEAGVSRDFRDVSRAVPHPAGTVILPPSVAGGVIRTVSSDDLEPIDGGTVQLDTAEATVGASFNADGSELAVLVTRSGLDVEYDTGATAVRVFEVAPDGVLTGVSRLVELPGSSPGRAKWIEWFDDATWVVERETDDSKVADVVGVDGTLSASNDDGWGWGLTRIDAGIVRSIDGGISVLRPDGTSIDVTVPDPDRIDRQLFLSPFVDPPNIEFPVLDSGDVPTISPPDPSIVDEVPTPETTTRTSGVPLVVVIGGLLLAGLGLAALGSEFKNWRSRAVVTASRDRPGDRPR